MRLETREKEKERERETVEKHTKKEIRWRKYE